ncbi:MAG: DUF1963 domain-containing protein [Pseudomonadota bacterium]
MAVTKRQVAQFLKVNARDAIAITSRPAAATDTSYSGGYPLLPKSLDWPRDPEGNECIFLAQIDLADLPVRPEGCETTGMLYVFLNAALEDCTDKPTSEPFLYYATADQEFELRKPSDPIAAGRYYWYTADRPGPISSGKDALPKSGWNFSVFVEQNYPGIIEGCRRRLMLTSAERLSLWEVKAPPGEIADFVSKHSQNNRKAVAKELPKPSFKGGFELIDPGFKLRSTWWGRPTVYDNTNLPLHPFFEEWPHTPAVIFEHAKRVAFSGGDFSPERDNDVDEFARKITEEAKGWVQWAKKNGASGLSKQDKENYIAWCQSAYARCFEAARPGVFDAPRVTKRNFRLRNFLYLLLPKKYRERRELIGDASYRRLIAIEQIYDPTVKAIGTPQAGEPLGQLLGYGESIQWESDLHRNKTLAFQCFDLPDLSFGGGDFKIWLASKTLRPNAWQRVVVCNSVS